MNDNTNDKVQKFTHCCCCGGELELAVVDLVPGVSGVICKSCMAKQLREEKRQVAQEAMRRSLTDLGYTDDSIREIIITCALCGGDIIETVATEEVEHARANPTRTICPACQWEERGL